MIDRPAALEQFLDGGVAFAQERGIPEIAEDLLGGVPFGPPRHEFGNLFFLVPVIPDAPEQLPDTQEEQHENDTVEDQGPRVAEQDAGHRIDLPQENKNGHGDRGR